MLYLDILPEEILSLIIHLLDYKCISNIKSLNQVPLLERIIKDEFEYKQILKNVYHDYEVGDLVLSPYKCYKMINNS